MDIIFYPLMAAVVTSSFPMVNAYTTGMKTEIIIRDKTKYLNYTVSILLLFVILDY